MWNILLDKVKSYSLCPLYDVGHNVNTQPTSVRC